MSFRLARLRGMTVPKHVQLPVAAGQAFLQGALLLRDANAEYAECGADPAAIGAIAETGFGADTAGFGRHGTKEFPPGYMQGIAVQDEVPFRARYVGALPAADGGAYGVIKDADDQWKVDFNETTATRVRLLKRFTNSPENLAEVEVAFLPANVQVL